MRDLLALRNAIKDAAFANNEIRTEGGDDRLEGTSGPDALCGESGNDTMIGRDGDDFIEGCWGDDIMSGGSGSDVYMFYVYSSHDIIRGWEDGKDIFELAFLDLTMSDVTITHDSAKQHTVTVAGHPEFSVVVLGAGFGYEDILLTDKVSIP